jgi:hypothetical protein
MLFRHRHFLDHTFLCSAEGDEASLGPGGVATPTPEPGPTPTPQPEQPAEPLKPVAALLAPKDGEPPAGEPKPEPKKDGAAERINVLTREKWEEKRAREAAEARAKLAEDTIAELQKLGVAKPAEGEAKPEPPKPAVRTFTQAEVEAEARRLAANAQFNTRMDEVVFAGRKEHPDFDEAIAGLKTVTGPVVPGEFLAAALETGSAGALIYHLGKNPSEADRILSMPAVAQAVALTKLASELGAQQNALGEAEPRVTRAPKPIAPRVGGATRAEPDLETMPMTEFIAKRNEQERAQRATRH